MNAFRSLAISMATARTESVSIQCQCGHRTHAGVCDESPTLPIYCQSCREPLDAASVLLANLKLARVETDQLATAVGTLLAALAVAYETNPRGVGRDPLTALERAVDLVALSTPTMSVARMHEAILRGRR